VVRIAIKSAGRKMYTRNACILHVFVSDERSLAYSSRILRSLGFIGSWSVRLGNKNPQSLSYRMRSQDGKIRLDFLMNPYYSKIRMMMKRPAFNLLSGMSRVLNPMTKREEINNDAGDLSLFTAFASGVPYLPPSLSSISRDDDSSLGYGPTAESNGLNTNLHLKEIILPCSSLDYDVFHRAQSQLSDIGAIPYRNVPGLYKFKLQSNREEHSTDEKAGRLLVRAAPTCHGSLIFKVDDINETLDQLREQGIRGNKLGFTGAWSRSEGSASRCGGGEVRLFAEGLGFARPTGLDFRITDSDEVLSYYSEGPEAVLDGTIADIQSDRVLGSPSDDSDSLAAGKSGLVGQGDCWMELRAMMKSPWRLMTEKNKFGSRPPSISGDYPMKE
jgi:hypothetical protein